MKTKLLILGLTLLSIQHGYSQNSDEQRSYLNMAGLSAGFGVPTQKYISLLELDASSSVSGSTLFKFSFDRKLSKLTDDIYLSVGGEICTRGMTVNSTDAMTGYPGSYDLTLYYFAARASLNYVFPSVPNLRLYGNVSYGEMQVDSSGPYGITSYDGQLFAGGRYFFNKSIGCFAELGIGQSNFNTGLNMRF